MYGKNNVDVGTITEFVIYITMLPFPVSAIGWVASMIQRASASQKRLNEFLDTESRIQPPPDAVTRKLQGNISFEQVDFTYPNTGIHALKQFDLQIKKGEKIVIIGRTGSGKTTLAQLLLRMYDPNGGRILIDGADLREMDLQDLCRQIIYINICNIRPLSSSPIASFPFLTSTGSSYWKKAGSWKQAPTRS